MNDESAIELTFSLHFNETSISTTSPLWLETDVSVKTDFASSGAVTCALANIHMDKHITNTKIVVKSFFIIKILSKVTINQSDTIQVAYCI